MTVCRDGEATLALVELEHAVTVGADKETRRRWVAEAIQNGATPQQVSRTMLVDNPSTLYATITHDGDHATVTVALGGWECWTDTIKDFTPAHLPASGWQVPAGAAWDQVDDAGHVYRVQVETL